MERDERASAERLCKRDASVGTSQKKERIRAEQIGADSDERLHRFGDRVGLVRFKLVERLAKREFGDQVL